jgi:molybdopterin molybdotransferase
LTAPLLPVADARHKIISSLKPVGSEKIELSQALGRVLAENVTARVSHPPADVSAMDGYAVCVADVSSTPTTLKIVGESAAGHPWTGEIQPGEAIRIFTGAYVPAGADSVVIQENTTADGKAVTINELPRVGKNIRPQAQDFQTGDAVLKPPRWLTARDIGLLAAMNLPEINVYRRPRIGILSTGDEIVQPGDTVGDGQIVSANGPGLCAFVKSRGGVGINLGIVSDNTEALLEAIKHAGQLDFLVTSGGVSVGDHDLVKKAASEGGLNLSFHKIAMRPGKPLLFGHFDQLPLLGLPGNPVSAMVCAILFLSSAIDALLGLPADAPKTIPARLTEALKANGDREDYIRAELNPCEGELPLISPLPKQDSAMIAALARASALIIRAPHALSAKSGDIVQAIPLT